LAIRTRKGKRRNRKGKRGNRKGKRGNRKAGSRDARGRIKGKIKIEQTEQNRKNTRCAKPYLHSR